jgi:hypothetical protein
MAAYVFSSVVLGPLASYPGLPAFCPLSSTLLQFSSPQLGVSGTGGDYGRLIVQLGVYIMALSWLLTTFMDD